MISLRLESPPTPFCCCLLALSIFYCPLADVFDWRGMGMAASWPVCIALSRLAGHAPHSTCSFDICCDKISAVASSPAIEFK